MDIARFDRLRHRMRRSRVSSEAECVGCSPEEVRILESRYAVRLPETYRYFLEVMGHSSGRLFTHDHLSVSYGHVLTMTADERDEQQRWSEDRNGPPPGFVLPSDALLIAGRLGEQFEFIRCIEPDDSPVWYYNTWDWQVSQAETSVLGWLESWCEEAEHAIADGYFSRFPDGTTP